MFGRLRQLIIAFFVYNCVSVVAYFHIFVDVANVVSTGGIHAKLSGYERAAAAFLFFDFMLRYGATSRPPGSLPADLSPGLVPLSPQHHGLLLWHQGAG
jgi:hypothetical protein